LKSADENFIGDENYYAIPSNYHLDRYILLKMVLSVKYWCRGDWSMPGHRVKRDSEGKNRKYQLI
jgi:hypothetical protein